jgi:fused signal recognition particle receptor
MFNRFKEGLKKTREAIKKSLQGLVKAHPKLDDGFFQGLEDSLITADMGVTTASLLIDRLKKETKTRRPEDLKEVYVLLKRDMAALMDAGKGGPLSLDESEGKPKVVMVVGVNGSGKTTSIAKLGNRFRESGKKIMLAAGDTFRAAAIDQLRIWAERTGSAIVAHQPGADPSAVIFDAVQAAKARRMDLVIADTAGRLHTKFNLMEELKKIKRVANKALEGAPHEIWLVLDATTGQNGVAQAREFHHALGLTGIILTKLDGTAKGAVVFRIANELNIPIRYVGVGEKPEDLKEFDPEEFVDAILDPDLFE